jgi:hypothetical protein
LATPKQFDLFRYVGIAFDNDLVVILEQAHDRIACMLMAPGNRVGFSL